MQQCLLLIIGLVLLSPVARAETIRIAPSDDRLRLQNAIDASRPGDTLVFGQGEFEPGRLVFRSQREYSGTPGKTIFAFDDIEFGVVIDGDAKDISISGITFDGAGIDMGAGGPKSHYSNIRITGNVFQNIAGHAIKCTIGNDRLVIEQNQFKSVRGYGAVELYHMNRGSFSRNTLTDCSHGGHILGPLEDCTFSFNRGSGLTHMGLEIQRSGNSVSRNMRVEGNVFYDWKLPFCNSFGLSIMAEGGVNTRVVNNYLRASRVGPWNPNLEGQGERFGIGIEAGFDTGVVEGNTIGGPFAHFVTASGKEMLVQNNQFYGQPKWKKTIARWPGNDGKGTFIDKNNSWNTDFDRMPPPPEAARAQANVSRAAQ